MAVGQQSRSPVGSFGIEGEPYEWMFTSDGGHHLDRLIEAREFLEGLKETSATFRPTDAFDWWSGRRNCRRILNHYGAWELPERLQENEKPLWVNPHWKWSPKYSDASVVCGCGAVQQTTSQRGVSSGADQPHEDYCTPQSRHYTIIEIWNRRESVIRDSAYHCLDYYVVAKNRLGVSKKTAKRYLDTLNIDYQALKRDGHYRLRATFIELYENHDVAQHKIGEGFGMNSSNVSKHINGKRSYYG